MWLVLIEGLSRMLTPPFLSSNMDRAQKESGAKRTRLGHMVAMVNSPIYVVTQRERIAYASA